ncbi:MAG: ABC-type Mn2+/Zn2+ transport system ATPase subunit [Glaciecola sp.]|jgi:ABC-type Mn2+/Zn2+ transport system ATPase subunit
MSTTGTITSPCVEAHNLDVLYGPTVAIRDVSLSFGPGVTAIIGPNGSGKTSILSAISGLLTPASGTLDVLGSPARPGRPDVAHVLQSTKLNESLPLTAREVVRMGRYPHLGAFRRFTSVDRAAVDEAMERLDITDLAGRQVRELSGGQQQRTFVAQGLAQQADLLLLDEPITGLDLPSQQRIAQTILEEAEAGRSVILTTHDLATAASADHVVLMATHVVASGTSDEVLTEVHLGHAYSGTTFRTADGALVIADPHTHGTTISGHDH